ncbi:maleylacetoacetate isomerase [Erythrobacter westpacificensis]|uniref:Maleylacetoacetate isomerase n=1 Tax=Erythrobacter westpacificensis TaxID=1055231 RepID=A0ABP9KAB9_9SPHN
MKLYGYWRSSTSYRLRCALELKGLEYEQDPVSLIEARHKEDSFTSRNPFAGVPMLEADGRDRAQSMAIIAWLDERYPDKPLLPSDVEQRFTARELAYAVATELHAPLNLKVLKYLKDPLGHDQEEINTWYRHWLAATLVPVEKRLKQLDTGDFLFDRPGLFEAVLVPQLYNARRFDFELDACDKMVRIEQACLALPEFQRAHPDNQPDAPEV